MLNRLFLPGQIGPPSPPTAKEFIGRIGRPVSGVILAARCGLIRTHGRLENIDELAENLERGLIPNLWNEAEPAFFRQILKEFQVARRVDEVGNTINRHRAVAADPSV